MWLVLPVGGAYEAVLSNCLLTGNFGSEFGGGAAGGTLNNCILVGNATRGHGGGAYDAGLNNCTITGNSAVYEAFGGGGVAHGTLNNCIVYWNSSEASYNYFSGTFNYCCTSPLPTDGFGNITNEPLFLDPENGNYHLQSNSPCINAGNNSYVTSTNDCDGNPRIVSGTVDIGAYEYQGAGSTISYAWLQQYGLPTDVAVDNADPDHDGIDNWHEWVIGLDPTNRGSCVRLTIKPSTPPVKVTFFSSAANFYTLQCCTNLTASPVWTPVPGQTDIPGTGDVLTLTDTNPSAPVFYRVSVRFP
jgi:hypothetical protein